MEVQLSTHEAEAQATEGHEKLDFEVKNSGKYMTTFPYPYMNGYLHLGKLIFATTRWDHLPLSLEGVIKYMFPHSTIMFGGNFLP